MSSTQKSRQSVSSGNDRQVLSKTDKNHLVIYVVAQEFRSLLKYHTDNPNKRLDMEIIERNIKDLRKVLKIHLRKFPTWTTGQSKLKDLCGLHIAVQSFERRLLEGRADMSIHASKEERWENCQDDIIEILDDLLKMFKKR